MLVLTRKLGEKIHIGEKGDIVVTVLAIEFGKIRLGIEAPDDVSIHREEVWLRIKELEAEVVEPTGAEAPNPVAP